MGMVTAVRGAAIALTLVLFAPAVLAAEQEDFYLGTDGFPHGSLVATPRGGEMPNFDLGRDIEPGLLLEKSTLGLAETEDTKYQHWQIEMGGQSLSGYPSVIIWSATASFDGGKRGALAAYLLDCNLVGSDCSELGAADVIIEMGRGGAWTESMLVFEPIEHRFGVGRYLAVRIVVPETSESDMMLAYGFPKHRSRLTIHAEPPAAPVEAAAISPVTVAGDSELMGDKIHRLAVATFEQTVESDRPETGWPWLASLALSTLVLVGLGTILVSRLAKPGRHEQRYVTARGNSAQARRISVSAR